ncbi:MAG TPA: S-layer homology domain-containing protein [Chloroflexia bacterium]|nr:S-layer homology domain-containing protein [Chloroflexia bacterium]
MRHHKHWRVIAVTAWVGAFMAAALFLIASGPAAAQEGPKPTGKPVAHPLAEQVIAGYPLTITVQDDTRMEIDYRDPDEYQFFGRNAEGAYLWANVGGTTQVFGPSAVPAGRTTNEYAPVSNVLTGNGSPSNPWVVTTVNTVPGTNLRLTQRATYVNGAEFTSLLFTVDQIGGSAPVTVTLFHAADLYTNGSDQGFGYYDPSTGGVGDYFTQTNGIVLYQQFVPNSNSPASAYMESYFSTIWNAIGSTSGPGDGFDNTIISDTLHDAGAGLQWNLTIPPGGSVTVGDTDLFSIHASLCGNFSDVPYGSFYYDYIYYLACHNIVSGYSDTTFRPSADTSRGQLAKIAANSAGFNETPTGQMFADVPATNSFYPYIQRMATRGLISGYNCGSVPSEPCDPENRPYFRPGASVTRGQIAKIVANARGLSDPIPSTQQTFADVPANSPFWLYVERLAALGTISGYSCGGPGEPCDPANRPYFRLGSNATRGQISKIDKLTFFP